MIVRESINNILKPKSKDEINNELSKLDSYELYNLAINDKSIINIILDFNISSYHLSQLLVKYILDDKEIAKQILKGYILSDTLIECLKTLIRHKNHVIYTNKEYYDVIDKILTHKNFKPTQDLLNIACSYGDLNIVKKLLKYKEIDPSFNDSIALKYAFNYGYDNIVNLLMNDNRILNQKMLK